MKRIFMQKKNVEKQNINGNNEKAFEYLQRQSIAKKDNYKTNKPVLKMILKFTLKIFTGVIFTNLIVFKIFISYLNS